ncbi:MAG: methyltransferase domain-containing protein [Hyphomicrobiales bacterium]|nr:methyltransferase domain-containing protein [Hyphomicrobiales bacterium]
MTGSTRDHWQGVYEQKADTSVSWYEATPLLSLSLIEATAIAPPARIIDIGGGASRLVDHLVARGFGVSVLDLSGAALGLARTRLGARASGVTWIEADVRHFAASTPFDLWHDRAALHFLTAREDQQAYVAALGHGLRRSGIAIIGTFAPDGPEKCSGLPVQRHDAESLALLLGKDFRLVSTTRHNHLTPGGGTQKFQFSTFQRVPA